MSEKKKKRAEYAAAEEYVSSFYEANSPPYQAEQLGAVMAEVNRLAPHGNLDQAWLERMLERLSHRRPEIHVKTRSQEEWEALFPRYPSTGDGFMVSFEPEEHDKIRQTLDKFGLVVVKAFSSEVCETTIKAMFEEINQLSAEKMATMEDKAREDRVDTHPDLPWTWEDGNWPSEGKFLIPRPAFHPQAFANRVAPRIYQLFATLWREERLRVSIDNWGATRGSRNLLLHSKSNDGEKGPTGQTLTDNPKWGKGIAPHWDYNPWLWVHEVEDHGHNPGYQAVVALNEHRPGMGCHQTLPGGTSFLRQWCREHGCPATLNLKRKSHRPPMDDPIRQYMQEIPLRQGEMIIWSSGQLHATAENISDKMRLHQYIRFFPASESGDQSYEEHDRYAPRRVFRQYSQEDALKNLPESLSLLGRRLVGLEEWPSSVEEGTSNE